MPVPKYDDLFNPLLTVLHQLGSSASIEELEKNNFAWARSYLKQYDGA